MKIKRCPYCGRRISYGSAFASRRKAEYICPKCGKESKVSVRRRNVVLIFGGVACVSLGIMAAWIMSGLVSNPLGILLVAVPFMIFGLLSPNFVHYDPLKKYKKSMEAKKAGIAYSDNLLTSELDEAENYTFPSINQAPQEQSKGGFEINADVFNKIREERNAARMKSGDGESEQNNDEADDGYVSVISSVSSAHASSGAGLKKIRSDSSQPRSSPAPRRHYVGGDSEQKSKSSSGNRYSQNRKF